MFVLLLVNGFRHFFIVEGRSLECQRVSVDCVIVHAVPCSFNSCVCLVYA